MASEEAKLSAEVAAFGMLFSMYGVVGIFPSPRDVQKQDFERSAPRTTPHMLNTIPEETSASSVSRG